MSGFEFVDYPKATIKDAVYGAAVGDALGVPFEFCGRGSFSCTGMVGHGTHDQEPGTWSDDTSMLLATCDSLKSLGKIDCEDMRARFIRWINEGAYAIDGVVFDFGITVSQALTSGKGRDDERSNGNGSLMRIIPLAFTNATDDQIREISAITHAHAVSREVCVRYIHIARGLLAGEQVDPSWANIPREQVRSGGFVRDTLQAALWCVASTNNYEECVLEAVNLGDDTDTTACVAGALAGILYGRGSIPSDWIQTLRGKDLIDGCLW